MIYLSNWKNYIKTNILIFLLAILYIHNAYAYTLHDAIISAHENNYDIKAQLERLNANKMALPKAYSAFFPKISFQGQFQKVKYKQYNESNANPNSRGYTLSIDQSLFNGGASLAQVKNAQYTIEGVLQEYKSASNSLTLNVTNAYTGVFYARNNYSINEHYERVLKETLELVKARFDAGQVTITDVLQAESRLADATAQKETAYGNIKKNEATLERLIGQSVPKQLEDVNLEGIVLPENLDELIEISLANNPDFRSLLARYNASKYDVYTSVAQMLPQVTASAQFNRNDNSKIPSTNFSPNTDTYLLNVNVPIFQGGFQIADIKEKKYLENKADFDQKEIERKIKERAIQSWNDWKTSKVVIKAQNENIIAAEKSFEAVKEEASIGTKTTLDVLNAEQEVFNGRVKLMNAESSYISAIYSILQIMGSIDVIEIDE